MYRFQTLSKDQLVNAVLCFADRISCSHCPIKEECLSIDKHYETGFTCEKMLIDFLTEELKQPNSIFFYEGFNEGFTAGYDACKRDIIDKLQKGKEKK